MIQMNDLDNINSFERVSVSEASKLLKMSPVDVKVLLEKGELPIGYVAIKTDSSNDTYYIYKEMLQKYIEKLATEGIQE